MEFEKEELEKLIDERISAALGKLARGIRRYDRDVRVFSGDREVTPEELASQS